MFTALLTLSQLDGTAGDVTIGDAASAVFEDAYKC